MDVMRHNISLARIARMRVPLRLTILTENSRYMSVSSHQTLFDTAGTKSSLEFERVQGYVTTLSKNGAALGDCKFFRIKKKLRYLKPG